MHQTDVRGNLSTMGPLKRMLPWCDLRSRHIVYTHKGTKGSQIKMVCPKPILNRDFALAVEII